MSAPEGERERTARRWRCATVSPPTSVACPCLDVDGRPLQGEFLRSATIVNAMIKRLGVFTSEVTRVARGWAPKASSAARRKCAR